MTGTPMISVPLAELETLLAAYSTLTASFDRDEIPAKDDEAYDVLNGYVIEIAP